MQKSRGRTMRAAALLAVIAACLILAPMRQVDATPPMTSGGRKFGSTAQYEMSYAIVGDDVDIEVAYRGRAAYFAVLFTTLNGEGHTGTAESILCNTGRQGTPLFAIAAKQGVGGKKHIKRDANLVVLKSAAASNILTKCRFTRPKGATGGRPLGLGTLDVVIGHGLSKIETFPNSNTLSYGQHNNELGRLNFNFADGQGGTPGQGLAVGPDPDPVTTPPDNGGGGGGGDLITEAPEPIDLEGDPAGGIPMEIMIAGGAGGLVAMAGLYSVVRKSGAGAPRRTKGRSKPSKGKGSYSGPPPSPPSKSRGLGNSGGGFGFSGGGGGGGAPMAMGMGMGGGAPPVEGSPWRAAMDPTSNRVYYFHKYTQETMWTKPPGFTN